MTPVRVRGEHWLTPARLVMTTFFIQGALLNNWYPRIPDVQAALGIGPADLAIGLLGLPVGTFAALAIAGRTVEWLTPRRTIVVGSATYCATMWLPGIAFDVTSLFVGLMVLGAVFATIDVAINTEATAIQGRTGRRIVSRCHGFWSLGAMAGAVVGAGFAEAGIATGWHLAIVGALTLVPANLIARRLPRAKEAGEALARAPAFSLPSAAMVGLAMFAFGMILAELATRNWAAVFLREAVGASAAATGVGYGAFSLCMAAGRFLGDAAAERLGTVTLARGCATAAVLGIVAVVVAPNGAVAIVGLAILGLGISIGYPLAVTAAAERRDRPAATNVASLALVAFSSMMIGPTLVGFVAEAAGLRLGLATMLPFVVVSALLAGQLDRRRAGSTPPSSAAS
jgi:MFS family permease